MPTLKQRMALDLTRGIKAYLNLDAGVIRGAIPEPSLPAVAQNHRISGGFNEVRREISYGYLGGEGIEVGALHQPLEVPPGASVRYVDRMTVEQLREQYPYLSDYNLTPVDIVDDGEKLATVDGASVDFVIANHMMEHCEDPIGTIENHLRVLKPGGILYMAVPDMRYTFDRERPMTPLDHMVRDYREGPEQSKREHLEEWARLLDKKTGDDVALRADELAETQFSIHFHVWTQKEFLELLHYCQSELGFPFEFELAQKNDMELICVLRKPDGKTNADPALQAEFDKRGSWVTKFSIDGAEYGGDFDAMRDTRVDQFLEYVPSPKRIMELGSLEGGHTFNLAGRPSVEYVLGIEGRPANIEKAEFVRGLLNVENAEFATANLEETDLAGFGRFDAVFCSGLLYHLPEPWKLVEQISRVSPNVFIWTHYAKEKAATTTKNGVKGMTYKEFGLEDPLSGMSPDSFWPTLDGLQDMLRQYGFETIHLIEDHPDHPHGGPAITLAASKS